MQEEKHWREESTDKREQDVHGQTIEPSTLVDRLAVPCLVFLALYLHLLVVLLSLLAGETLQLWLARFALWLFPYSKLVPVVSGDQSHGQLYETEEEATQPDKSACLVTCLAVLYDDIVEPHHVETDYEGHDGRYLESIVHVDLRDLLHLEKCVRRLYFGLYRRGVAQQRHDFIAMRIPLHIVHYGVAQIV